jgi:fructosamine-3-kinase
MKEKDIKKIFKDLNIIITKIKPATNSYNSSVYICFDENSEKKYIFKICNNEKKRKTESEYLLYLNKYILVPDIINNGSKKDVHYIIIEFICGDSMYDEESRKLLDKTIEEIGQLLAKLHTVPLSKIDDNWKEYLLGCLEKTKEVLDGYLGSVNNQKIYEYLKKYINDKLDYNPVLLHMDFRIGNLIFNNDGIYLIDLESVKSGDSVFDFVKMSRILTVHQFKILLKTYNKNRTLDNNFKKKLVFYRLFDSYTSLFWCISKNQINSNYFEINSKVVNKGIKDLNEKGTIF